ncbi:nucleotidyl transferase AbiEii/AbiGii toxin family protein [Promicromonospora soli]|uniref:Nucleotidyltransferase AbiEii toxin of type IV toxin-antitoxin system n=1 Tax=Promicromonospora soli TaxID=2035533 RepID=A0A919G205_9MICO|nr:nucleotidyl transferase AbiEii/AbiGii toxin family protein [Promicromonospora soli]GHH76144.1 hypothetical protein GCM10017772_33970 [Promicromonospora soli]
MRPFHDRLARIGLEAVEKYGFVLAGGYAISANGMGDRPSADVDLFTDRGDPEQFAEAVDELRRGSEPMDSSLPTTGSAPRSQTCT